MSRFWTPLVRALRPYVPGEQPAGFDLIKLNTNENPYGPSPRALEAIRAEVERLRLYPDPTSLVLRTAIAEAHGLGVDQVFVGNGSDEVLAHAFHALFRGALPLLRPDVSYSFYPTYCTLYGIDSREVPVDATFGIDVDAYRGPAGGVVLANPNAPTGRAIGRDAVRRLLDLHPDSVVLVDEAYVDFGGESAVPLLAHYPNLLVVQTLSKSRSLAGLRVGFALGHADLVEALVRVKDSFNSYPLDRLAIAGATAAMADVAWFERTRQAVMRTRERLTSRLSDLGFDVLPSAANFVFARHPDRDAADLLVALRARRVLVRHFAQPRIDQHLRITVGTDDQTDAFIDALRAVLGERR